MCPLLPVLSERETRTARLSDRHIRDFLRYLIHRPKQPFNRCSAGENSTHTHREHSFSFLSLILPLPITVNQAQSINENGAKQAWTQRSSEQLGFQITMVNKINFQPPHHHSITLSSDITPTTVTWPNHITASSCLPISTPLHLYKPLHHFSTAGK